MNIIYIKYTDIIYRNDTNVNEKYLKYWKLLIHSVCTLKQYLSVLFCLTFNVFLVRIGTTLKKMIFALCSISLIKMSSYNITLGKNGPNLILLNINNVI